MVVPQDVEFKTVDGITLRGHMFAAKDRGPGVVMSPGVSFTSNLRFDNSTLPLGLLTQSSSTLQRKCLA